MQVFYSLFMSEPALFHNTAGSFCSLCKYILYYLFMILHLFMIPH